mmetsp:Transcript_122905/g.244453  ORF Transcript_122905/g.244453 Transcript_122905/m.244453 type:complete len:210 (+) Transcript_122905:1157-1786(+)
MLHDSCPRLSLAKPLGSSGWLRLQHETALLRFFGGGQPSPLFMPRDAFDSLDLGGGNGFAVNLSAAATEPPQKTCTHCPNKKSRTATPSACRHTGHSATAFSPPALVSFASTAELHKVWTRQRLWPQGSVTGSDNQPLQVGQCSEATAAASSSFRSWRSSADVVREALLLSTASLPTAAGASAELMRCSAGWAPVNNNSNGVRHMIWGW